MFYLINFYKGILRYPSKGILFILITILMVLSVQNRTIIQRYFESKVLIEKSYPYFYALIAGEKNIRSFARKLENLPGVYNVTIIDPKKINEKLEELIVTMDLDVPKEVIDSSYSSLEITLVKDVKHNSVTLIKEYLLRTFSKENVVLSEMKNVEANSNAVHSSSNIKVIINFLSFLIIGLFFTLWLLSYWQFSRIIKKISYIVEQYQRKKYVELKTLALGITLIVLFTTGVMIYIDDPLLIETSLLLIVFLLSTLLSLKKTVWKY